MSILKIIKNYDSSIFKLMKAMLLAVAYSANIGGIGTLIGTPVNLILVDQLQTVFIENKEEIKFFSVAISNFAKYVG